MEKLQRPPVEDHLMWDIWSSLYFMPTLTAADELSLFITLRHGTMGIEEICDRLKLNQRPVEGMLGVLTGFGFLKRSAGNYGLTQVSRTYLLPDSPFYWGHFFRQIREWPVSHSGILEAIKRDSPTVTDVDIYNMTAEMQEMAISFTHAMHAVTLAPALAAVDTGIFEKVDHLLDVGGGSGNFSIALAQHDPNVTCTVLELGPVCRVVDEYAQAHGVSDRIVATPCDFFKEEWPGNCDAVFFGNIFHNWDDGTCRDLARKVYDYLPRGGRIFLQEMLLDDGGHSPVTIAANTMVMLFNNKGKQFTGNQIRVILDSVGFADIKISATHGYYAIISAVKPSLD